MLCIFVGPSILAAKLATKKAKPNGQFYVGPADMNTFILDKAVRDLPGIVLLVIVCHL